ncbi:MAG: DUF559 domain-containing protein [Elusimicrobiota bacterium]
MPLDRAVLVGVIKNSRDLGLVLKNLLYRMPAQYAPKRKIRYAAFYQPRWIQEKIGLFKITPDGFDGVIRYYAQIKTQKTIQRLKILPQEKSHPRAKEPYVCLGLGPIHKLKTPITNRRRMRITFGFTTLKKLRGSKEVKELFEIPPLEEIVEGWLKKLHLPYQREYHVRLESRRRYRLDFALPQARLAIECDGVKAHARAPQKRKDALKDQDLNRLGWQVLRLKEKEILSEPDLCRQKISSAADARIGFNSHHPILYRK